MFRAYMSALKARPLLVKTLTGTGTAFVGDIVAQKVKSGGEEPLDLQRLAAFTAFGAGWTGPVNHQWLYYLERAFPTKGGARTLAIKVFIQQGLWSPIVYLPAFFAVNNALRGRNMDEIVDDIRERFWPTYMSCLMFWIPTNTLVFARVPEPLQSVTMAGINCVWNTLLSFVANAKGGLFGMIFGSDEDEGETEAPKTPGAKAKRALLARANSSLCSSNIGATRRRGRPSGDDADGSGGPGSGDGQEADEAAAGNAINPAAVAFDGPVVTPVPESLQELPGPRHVAAAEAAPPQAALAKAA